MADARSRGDPPLNGSGIEFGEQKLLSTAATHTIAIRIRRA
jgi:hypothetical protein